MTKEKKELSGKYVDLVLSDTGFMIFTRGIILFIIFLIGLLINCSFNKEISPFPLIEALNIKVLSIIIIMLILIFMTRKALYYFLNGFKKVEGHLSTINKKSAYKIKKIISRITSSICMICVLFISLLFTTVIFKEWHSTISAILFPEQYNFILSHLSYSYAFILSVCVIFLAFYGYLCLGIFIWIAKILRNSKFKNYYKSLPVATPIIQDICQVLNKGLALFWAIGLGLLYLASQAKYNYQLMNFGESGNALKSIRNNYQPLLSDIDLVTGIIIIIFVVGYIAFTYFPYYYLHKIVGKLKTNEIKRLNKKLKNKVNKNEYVERMRAIFESPTIYSSNFWSILISTVLAMVQFALLWI